MRISFQSLPAHDAMVARIVAAYRAASPEHIAAGLAWYPQARALSARLARLTGVTTAQAAGVIAALSPSTEWAQNQRAASAILLAHHLDAPLPRKHTGPQMAKVRAILALEGGDVAHILPLLKGPKESAFFRNIMGDGTTPTVDRWAFLTATGQRTGSSSIPAYLYGALAASWIAAADILGLTVGDLQAILWGRERELATAMGQLERAVEAWDRVSAKIVPITQRTRRTRG